MSNLKGLILEFYNDRERLLMEEIDGRFTALEAKIAQALPSLSPQTIQQASASIAEMLEKYKNGKKRRAMLHAPSQKKK